MARSNSWPIAPKQLLSVGIIALSLFGLLVFMRASQEATNTRSDAAYCNTKPTWKFISTENRLASVIYHLKLVNNCPGSNNFVLKVTQTPTEPVRVSGWSWKFANGEWNTPYEKPNVSANNNEVNLTVARPGFYTDSKYVELSSGRYSWVKLRATLANNPDVGETINLYYNVE